MTSLLLRLLLLLFLGLALASSPALAQFTGCDNPADQTDLPTDQCEALLALYNSTDGPNWNDNTDWLSTNTPCSWFGVTCNSGQVRNLLLSGNDLSGPLPSEIGDLASARQLRFDNNNLTGSIPVEVGNLSQLTHFRACTNNLTGGIPIELGTPLSLRQICLGENQLTGSIPTQLGNLTNLTNLLLGNNQLSGSIPVELGNLASLQVLTLYSNDLTGTIPTQLGNLSNLQELWIYDNQLTGSIPTQLGNLTNLEELLLGTNQLSGSIPVELGSLANLQELRLGNNQLTGSIPTEVGDLTLLEALELGSNQLSGGIPTELGNLINLTQLLLGVNDLSGSIPSELGDLTNLTRLQLGANDLTGPLPAELGDLTNLTEFILENNQLTDEVPLSVAELGAVVGNCNFTNNNTLCIPDTIDFLNIGVDPICGLPLDAACGVAGTPPTVTITAPAEGTPFAEGDDVTIKATASDADGTVTMVEFYQGAMLLGSDTSAPYSFTWSNVAAGSYALTAIATDNDGLTTTSSVVNIVVFPSVEGLSPASIAIAEGTGIVAAGTGMINQPGTINIDVPAGSTVKQVLLYWEGMHNPNSQPVGDGDIVIDGNLVTGTKVGGPALFEGIRFVSTYRADITALGLVNTGANSLTVSGMTFNRDNCGAGIVVIYDDGSGAAAIDLRDGVDIAFIGFPPGIRRDAVPQTYTFDPAPVARTATLSMFFSSISGTASGGGFRPTVIEVDVDGTAASYSVVASDGAGTCGVVRNETSPGLDLLDSCDGEEWDTLNMEVEIPAGTTTLTVVPISDDRSGVGGTPASLTWKVGMLSMPPGLLGTIGDRVWNDKNSDGVQDPDEPGLEGVKVTLFDSNGMVAMTTTGPNGEYLFTNLPADDYTVVVDDGTLPDLCQNGSSGGGDPQMCFAVPDRYDKLVRLDKTTGNEVIIGHNGVTEIEAIALSLDGSTLYAANDNSFGTLDLNTGAFSPIGNIGSGNGSAGTINLSEPDGMTFDPTTGLLYATHRRGSNDDLLFQINPATGALVSGAFSGNDYVVIPRVVFPGPSDDLFNADDIAVDPFTGQMYGILNRSGENDHLVQIDKATGARTVVGPLGIDDMEGLTFDAAGQLFGTTGNENGFSTDNTFYSINTSTGMAAPISRLDLKDYEAVACPTGCQQQETVQTFDLDDPAGDPFTSPNQASVTLGEGETNLNVDFGYRCECLDEPIAQGTIGDRVWNDKNSDGVQDPDEPGLEGVKVTLFDSNGMVAMTTTGPNGEYLFTNLPADDYTVVVDDGTLPDLCQNGSSGGGDPQMCFAVSEENKKLTSLDKTSGIEDIIGSTGRSKIEAIALSLDGSTLYAADAGTFGTLNLTTGAFSTIGSFGTAGGSKGNITLSDVDGMAFDPTTGILYGTHRRGSNDDLLFQINTATGAHVPNAFGGNDYVVIPRVVFPGPSDDLFNADDIAVDPFTGQMYGILNRSGENDHLVQIDKATGARTVVGPLGIDDMEGLTFDAAGQLFGTTGDENGFSTDNTFYRLNKATGAATMISELDLNDYEAVACPTGDGCDEQEIVQTFDLDDPAGDPFTSPNQASVALGEGETNLNVDFGYRCICLDDPDLVTKVKDIRVYGSYDDAEEKVYSGYMYLNSSDLELTEDGSKKQLVGMRFRDTGIPQGATITKAYIQFTVDETDSEPTSLTIQGQDANDAPSFNSSTGNISSRPRTSASVGWMPAAWNTVGEAGPDQRTPDLSSIIQEIVNRSGWQSDDLVIIITGTGERTAESYDGNRYKAPLLHLEWTQTSAHAKLDNADENALEASELADVPTEFVLEGNYPNPFNPTTNIRFSLPEDSDVQLTVYDMLGRTVKVLLDGNYSSGTHTVTFEAGDLPSGTYVYRIETSFGAKSGMMSFIK